MTNSNLIPQKETEVCNLIKKLTEDGTKDVDYDEYKIGDICDLKDGYDFYKNEMDDKKFFVDGENLPLIKNNNNQITDYIKINKKYDKYIAVKNDILISTAGTCGRVIKLNFDKGYHAHHMIKFDNMTIDKNYFYYSVKPLFDAEFIKNNTNGSVLGHLRMEVIKNTQIRILKPHIMTKYNIQSMFDHIDNLKTELDEAKLKYKSQTSQLFKDLNRQSDQLDQLDQSETDEIVESKIKSKYIPEIDIEANIKILNFVDQTLKDMLNTLNIKSI